ncbi:MAG: hypothetical protein H8Z69_04665 [Nanohaloarchaea archaeon]|nr:hypothetical protein [Candidatus Nanohaloarchaea archaeon]
MSQDTIFNPYNLADYFGREVGESVQAVGFYTEDDHEVIYDGLEGIDLSSTLENLRDQNLYVRERAKELDDNVNASVHILEDRCELLIFGESDTEGFVAYLEPEVREGSNLDSFAKRCTRILSESY